MDDCVQTQEAVTAARALLEFTEQTVELPRDLICELLSLCLNDFVSITRWREDWSSASVVSHTIVAGPTIRQPGFNLPCHTWSWWTVSGQVKADIVLTWQMGSRPIIFLWFWPASDREPHWQRVPIDKILRWTESTPRSRWWRSHMAGIYSDCSTHEIIITISVMLPLIQ